METRYNIYFAGQLLEGQQPGQVREKLAKLFNADQQTLDKLFSGRKQLLKRDCDKATALKYKQAMERAGALPVIAASQAETSPPEPKPTAEPAAAPPTAEPRKMTAAERIAALAAAPDEDRFRSPDASNSQAAASQTPSSPPDPDEPGLAPAGAEILQADERPEPVAADINVEGMAVMAPAERLAPEAAVPPPPPDTSHLEMGDVGDSIPGLATGLAPPPPDISAIELAPEGSDLAGLAADAAGDPLLDLSDLDLDLAPVGSEVLEEQYRHSEQAAAPDTAHITLED